MRRTEAKWTLSGFLYAADLLQQCGQVGQTPLQRFNGGKRSLVQFMLLRQVFNFADIQTTYCVKIVIGYSKPMFLNFA